MKGNWWIEKMASDTDAIIRALRAQEYSPMFGAVIVFTEGTTREQAELYVKKIRENAKVASVEGPNGFDPETGVPVWYIP